MPDAERMSDADHKACECYEDFLGIQKSMNLDSLAVGRLYEKQRQWIKDLRAELAAERGKARHAFHVGYSIGMEDGGAMARGMRREELDEDAEWEMYQKTLNRPTKEPTP